VQADPGPGESAEEHGHAHDPPIGAAQ